MQTASPPSTNGVPSLAPIEALGNDREPDTGRFLPGNKTGRMFQPGNRAAAGRALRCRKTCEWRGLLNDAVGDDDFLAIVAKMIAAAKEGDWEAAKLLLAYLMGKPVRTLELDLFEEPPPAP